MAPHAKAMEEASWRCTNSAQEDEVMVALEEVRRAYERHYRRQQEPNLSTGFQRALGEATRELS